MNDGSSDVTLSAYIITRDEEDNIVRAIESVMWMDEVVVLDSGSTDATVEIAKKLGARVYESTFEGFVKQKNKAMDLCRGAWVFNLDADEEVTPELRTSIERVVRGNDKACEMYRVPRRNRYLGRWIRHCGWYPEYRMRLCRRGKARWNGELLHEALEGKGSNGTLAGDLLHRPYNNLGEHIRTIGRYTEVWAEREAASGRSFSCVNMVARPPIRFLKMYILRGGVLDGIPGLVASVMGAWYVFLKYARLYEYTGKKE